MRSFEDDQGHVWQAAVMEASYGVEILLFSPMEGSEMRIVYLEAQNSIDAGRELEALTDDDLRRRLDAAEDWQNMLQF